MVKPRSPRRDVRSPSAAAAVPAADEALTFRAAVRDVKPLKQVPAPAGLAKPKPRRPRRTATADADLDDSMPLLPVPAEDAVVTAAPVGAVLSFQRAGVRTQVLRRLRRGLIPTEGEIDLHGLTQSAAREHLAQFLRQSRDLGWRCVRVIHGKGQRSGTRGPVLKTAVDHWLRRHLDVMAFASARAIDGGTGAVYVLLRS